MKFRFLIVVLGCLASPLFSSGQAVGFDSTFNGNGIIINPIGSTNDEIRATALQQDGKIVAAGLSSNGTKFRFAITRYLDNGIIDSGFANFGVLVDSVDGGSCSFQAVAIQSDGKIVAAGITRDTATFKDNFVLARYLPDGTIDNMFGPTGKVVTDFYGYDDHIHAIVLQPDGKIVVAGSAQDSMQILNFAMARYDPDGSPDLTFGNNGKTHFNFGMGNAYANAMKMQSDGKFVLCGYTATNPKNNFAVARIEASGILDTTFGVGGKQITILTNNESQANCIALQTDGKILVGGWTIVSAPYYDFALIRYLPDGTPDSSFNNTGTVITSFGPYTDYPHALSIQPDGKIIIAGASSPGGLQNEFAMARFLSDGSPDNSFGNGGKLITPISPGYETIYSLQIQTDGKLVAGGFSQPSGISRFTLVRYSNDLSSGWAEQGKSENSCTIYPNPVDNEIVLTFNLISDDYISIRLIDMLGKHLKWLVKNQFQFSGKQTFKFPMGEEITAGLYLLQVMGSDHQITVRFSRQK